MTNIEISTTLKAYALEDMGYAREGGTMAITDTKIGIITLNHSDGMYQAFNRMGEMFTGRLDSEHMQKWLAEKYIVEIN